VKFVSIGGKIAKQAKALSNFWDNVVKCFYNDKRGDTTLVKLLNLRCHQYRGFLCTKVNPHLEKNGNRLNLVMFKIRLIKRSFSSTPVYNKSLSSDRVSKRKLNTLSLKWPKSWKKIEEGVFSKQQALSKLATKKGSKSLLVQNYQNQLTASLDFRLVAVRRVRSNKGSKLAGIDNIIPKDDID